MTGLVCQDWSAMADLDTKDVTILSHKIGVNEEDILKQYKTFLEKYPEGEMTKEQFVSAIQEKNKSTDEDSAENLFSIFDADESGTMDFLEFMMASNATTLKTLEDKLNWIFNVYDKDAGGTIDPDELKDIVTGLFSMAGIDVPEEIVDVRSKELSEIIDVDGDGEITKEEFIKNALTCEFISDMLQVGIGGDSDDSDYDEE